MKLIRSVAIISGFICLLLGLITPLSLMMFSGVGVVLILIGIVVSILLSRD